MGDNPSQVSQLDAKWLTDGQAPAHEIVQCNTATYTSFASSNDHRSALNQAADTSSSTSRPTNSTPKA